MEYNIEQSTETSDSSTPYPPTQNKRLLNRKIFIVFGLVLIFTLTIAFLFLSIARPLTKKGPPIASPTPYPTTFSGKIFVDKELGFEVRYGSYPYDDPKYLTVRKTAANIFRFVVQTPTYDYSCPPAGGQCRPIKKTGTKEAELMILTVGKYTNLSNYKTCDSNQTPPCISNICTGNNCDANAKAITISKLGDMNVGITKVTEKYQQYNNSFAENSPTYYIIQTIKPPYLEFITQDISQVKSIKLLKNIACPLDTITCPNGASMSRIGPTCNIPTCPDYGEGKYCNADFQDICPLGYGCKFVDPYPANWGYCIKAPETITPKL